MRYVRELMTSRPMPDRIPDQTLLAENSPDVEHHAVATRAADGSYAFVYAPTGRAFSLNTAPLADFFLIGIGFNVELVAGNPLLAALGDPAAAAAASTLATS